MLSDRHRHLLSDMERQFEHEDPAWVRQFTDFSTPRPTRGKLALDAALGVAVVLAAVGLLLGIPGMVLIFSVAALALAFIRHSLRRVGVHGQP
jgi:hypothetical protein